MARSRRRGWPHRQAESRLTRPLAAPGLNGANPRRDRSARWQSQPCSPGGQELLTRTRNWTRAYSHPATASGDLQRPRALGLPAARFNLRPGPTRLVSPRRLTHATRRRQSVDRIVAAAITRAAVIVRWVTLNMLRPGWIGRSRLSVEIGVQHPHPGGVQHPHPGDLVRRQPV